MEFVLTRKLCEDVIEEYVGRQRSLSRRNDHPTVRQFGHNDNTLRMQRSVVPVTGNSMQKTTFLVQVCMNNQSNNIQERMTNYNSLLSEIVDRHAPIKTKQVKIVPNAPWFDLQYKSLRQRRRKAEKKFKITGLAIHKDEKRTDHITIINEEIISLIRKINPGKATGSDGISGQMLLLCDDSVILPLKIIFSNILSTSNYPHLWKVANVIPIHKKGDKQLIKNYRPISLLPICGKIIEKIIFNYLYSYLIANRLITINQSGFRPGDSTTNQLLYLVDEIHQAFDSAECFEVRTVFLDISKAFDKVWHDGLIFKLKQNGISGSRLKLFRNYLSNRKQCVVLNGSSSDYSGIESGVPQGSVLGPLLFLIYINGLERNIKSNIKFFADDTMIFSIVNDPKISANDLNHETIRQWVNQWKLEFNPEPT